MAACRTEEEKKFWAEIENECMSDLEVDEDENHDKHYVRHRLVWRTDELVEMIDRLDSRIQRHQLSYPTIDGAPSDRRPSSKCPRKFIKEA